MSITAWSHSRLMDFEKCKFMAFLKYEKRIPEPERPLPPGRTEHANDRGTRVHEAAELYVRGTLAKLPLELKGFAAEFEALRELYPQKKVSLEGEWGYDREWHPTEWRKAWLRSKLDAFVHLSEYEAVAIDFKTGKKFGNEIKHGEQLTLYQLESFLRFPQLDLIHTELWYLDQNELTQSTYTRSQGLQFLNSWNKRGMAMTTCEEFPPNANRWSCRYCPYGMPEHGFENGTGHCKAGRR